MFARAFEDEWGRALNIGRELLPELISREFGVASVI